MDLVGTSHSQLSCPATVTLSNGQCLVWGVCIHTFECGVAVAALNARKWYQDWRELHEAWFLKGNSSVDSVHVLSCCKAGDARVK